MFNQSLHQLKKWQSQIKNHKNLMKIMKKKCMMTIMNKLEMMSALKQVVILEEES